MGVGEVYRIKGWGEVRQFADLRGGGGLAKKMRCFLLHLGTKGAFHGITKSADSPKNKTFSGNDCMSASFYKNIYQMNDFSLRILGNKKVFEKTQIGWRQMLVTSHPCTNNNLVIVVKIYTEADIKVS